MWLLGGCFVLEVFNTHGHFVLFCSFCPGALWGDGLFRFTAILAVFQCLLQPCTCSLQSGQCTKHTRMLLPYFALKSVIHLSSHSSLFVFPLFQALVTFVSGAGCYLCPAASVAFAAWAVAVCAEAGDGLLTIINNINREPLQALTAPELGGKGREKVVKKGRWLRSSSCGCSLPKDRGRRAEEQRKGSASWQRPLSPGQRWQRSGWDQPGAPGHLQKSWNRALHLAVRALAGLPSCACRQQDALTAG